MAATHKPETTGETNRPQFAELGTRQTPAIEIHEMNETKNPCRRVRTYRRPTKMGSGWNIVARAKGRKATRADRALHAAAPGPGLRRGAQTRQPVTSRIFRPVL